RDRPRTAGTEGRLVVSDMDLGCAPAACCLGLPQGLSSLEALVMNACCCAVLAGCLLAPQDSPSLAPKGELEGEWAVVVWDCDGFWFTTVDNFVGDHYRDLRFTFTCNRLKITLRDGGHSLGWLGWDGVDDPYRIDPSRSPKEIDIDQFGHGVYSLK